MNDTSHKAPEPGFTYPTKMDGQGIEYGSAIITLDHLSAGREGNPHIHTKFVFSTQDEVEALFANFAYYGEASLALRPHTAKLVGELFTKDFPVLVYNPAPTENFAGATQIILAMDTFIEAINHPAIGDGSILQAVEHISQATGRLYRDMLAGQPESARVPLFGFELEMPEVDDTPEQVRSDD